MMKMNVGLAEFVGAFIGDGCMSQYLRKGRHTKTRVILFTGNWEKDSQYYSKIINPILVKNFGKPGRIYHRKDDNTVRFIVGWKEVFSFLLSLGFSFGPKASTVFIPDIILNDKTLSFSCLRGIFNTDGCIYSRYSKKYNKHPKIYSNYAVIQFKSNSKLLMNQVSFVLKREGIIPNRIIKDKNAYVLRITNQKEIGKFLPLVNINHDYHKERIMNLMGPEGFEPPTYWSLSAGS